MLRDRDRDTERKFECVSDFAAQEVAYWLFKSMCFIYVLKQALTCGGGGGAVCVRFYFYAGREGSSEHARIAPGRLLPLVSMCFMCL